MVHYYVEAVDLILLLILPQSVHPIYGICWRRQGDWVVDLVVGVFSFSLVFFHKFGDVVNSAAGLIFLRVFYALGFCDLFILSCHYCGFS